MLPKNKPSTSTLHVPDEVMTKIHERRLPAERVSPPAQTSYYLSCVNELSDGVVTQTRKQLHFHQLWGHFQHSPRLGRAASSYACSFLAVSFASFVAHELQKLS
jgi:hypothetical protein